VVAPAPKYAACTSALALTAAGGPSAISRPSFSTAMESDSAITMSILCSTSRIVRSRRSRMRSISPMMAGTSSSDMPAVGSSSSSTSGSRASRMPSSSLRFSPWASAPATACHRLSSSTASSWR